MAAAERAAASNASTRACELRAAGKRPRTRARVSGLFKPGQMVRLNVIYDVVELYDAPGIDAAAVPVGRLAHSDVALVVNLRWHGSSVYVIGPTGCGWTMGAYLDAV